MLGYRHLPLTPLGHTDVTLKRCVLHGKEGTDMIRPFLQLAQRDSLTKIGSLAGLGHVLVDRQVLPVHFETGNAGSSHTVGVGVVQRNGREIVEQHFLSLLVQLIGLIGGLRGSSLGAQVIELRILVIAIVGTIAISSVRGIQLVQVVFRRRSQGIRTKDSGRLGLATRPNRLTFSFIQLKVRSVAHPLERHPHQRLPR